MSKVITRSSAPLGVWLSCVLAASAGCGGSGLSLGKVSGAVTLGGQPVTNGTVVFVPEEGPAATGTLDAEGHYFLTTHSRNDGAVVGRHVVTILPPTAGAVLEPGKLPAAPVLSKTGPAIPAKYQNATTSGLSAEVQPGRNVLNFKL